MKIKDIVKKISKVLSTIFGYGIMLSLFVGGLTFFGYLIALFIGGDIAAEICTFLYKTVLPIIIKTSTIMVLLGVVVMYLNGEVALTSNKKKASKHNFKI
mgnify:CR=1 FL=1